MKPESKLFKNDKALTVEFPFILTKDIIDKLIKKPDGDEFDKNDNWKRIYM